MKEILSRMTALSMLLAAGGISAQAGDSFEVLENYSSVYFLYDDSTDTSDDICVGNAAYFYKNTNAYTATGNNAVQFTFESQVDISDYDYLVIETEEAIGDYHFEPCLTPYTSSSYWGAANNTFGDQGTSDYYALNLETYKDTIGDSKVVGTVVLLFNAGTSGDTITFKSVRFEKPDVLDYAELDYSAGYCVSGTEASVDDTYMKITFGDNRTSYWGWDISDVYTSNYKYLVVVPRIPYCGEDDYESELGTGAASNIQYSVSDGTNEIGNWDYSFAYGWWQRRRACVLDLEDGEVYSTSTNYDKLSANTVTDGDTTWTWKSWLPGADLQVLKMCCQDENGGSYEISAIYFTNEQPTYTNIAWDGASNWDYICEATTMGTYGTVCLPYASAICGARAYDVVGYGTDESGNPSELYLQEVFGVLEAGKAYVYKTVATTYDTQEGYVTFTKAGANTVSTANTGDALVGTFEESGVTVTDGYYILDTDSTVWSSGSNNTVAQYCAYLNLSALTASDATTAAANGWESMSVASGTTTGIREIASEDESAIEDDAIYNLSGVRVTNPQKGIYIKNGKKYIVK